MASGGSENNKHAYSEPRNRSLYSRLLNTEEDGVSTGSASANAQDRLNNWDFSNWQPSSNFDGTKQPKRANEEKEPRNRKKIGKENITGAVGDASPQAEGSKQHRTPSTFPRTKVTPVMPLSQRMALENLRQHMTFSDVDELSTDGLDRDGERNNQRYVPRRGRPVEMSLERNEVGGASNKNTEPSRDNRNTNRNLDDDTDDKPDSTQIVGRLMQIRDYIKQASSMMERLQSSGDPSDQGRASQLEQVINRLKEQEQKYLELLLKLSQDEGYITKLQILVDHLKQQEAQMRNAVVLDLTAKEEGLLMRQNSLPLPEANGMNSQVESESEAATELDVGTDTSENEDAEPNADDGRPLIEDKLGQQTSDTEELLLHGRRTDSRFSDPVTPELDHTLVYEAANTDAAAADLLAKRHILESDLTRKNDELHALKEQHDLLRKMLDQQEQLRELQTRQAALVMMQQEAEQRLAEEQDGTNDKSSAKPKHKITNESTKVKNSNLSKNSEPDLFIGVTKDNVAVGKSHIPVVIGPDGKTIIPEHAKGSISIGTEELSYVHPDDGKGTASIQQKKSNNTCLESKSCTEEANLTFGEESIDGEIITNLAANAGSVTSDNQPIFLSDGGAVNGGAPIVFDGNSPASMVLGSSGIPIPFADNTSQVVIQNNCGPVTVQEGENGQVVETYKVFYVVEWCEEDETDEEGKSETSCHIMEVDDIEDNISEIAKPPGSTTKDITMDIEEVFDDGTSETGTVTKDEPRSDVSEAGSSNVGHGSVSSEPDNDNYSNNDNSEFVPQELQDLRQRLDYLKNLYEIKTEPDNERDVAAELDTTSVLTAEKAQLQNKLSDLQQKKAQMDKLLSELQVVNRDPRGPLNNEMDRESTTSSRINESIAATAAANQVEDDAQGLMEMLESRNKLKKLQEVKDRLSQLKGLVQYYQSGQDFIHGSQPTTVNIPAVEQERPARPQRPPDFSRSRSGAGRSTNYPRKPTSNAQQQRVDASDTSDTASQQSSAWGEDPEIQEKVRRLNDAKDKLRRLQDLVAVIQSSPDGARNLPEDLAELAASIEGESQSSLQRENILSSSGMGPRREGNLSLTGAVAANAGYSSATDSTEAQYDQQEAYYQMRMMEQKDELESLMEERKKLLLLQQELQRLHDTLPQNPAPSPNSQSASLQPPSIDISSVDVLNNQSYMQPSPNNRELAGETTRSQESQSQGKAPEPFGVTFQEPLETVISNEELYGRMRQQRMLREELREKKKELEDMMRKDRPKKQYSRNQDNQSDNVSYSNRSEQLFGGSASVDQTMATWGGSTVDNLESIEEDGGNSGDGQETGECDDGYPSDGIVQVEEEEEQDAVDDNSDDRDTYTIEEEPYVPKGRSRRQQTSPPMAEGGSRQSGIKKSNGKGAPFQGQGAGESYNYWAPDNNQVLNNVRTSSNKSRKKRDRENNALKEELQAVKEQIAGLKDIISNSNKNPTGPNAMGNTNDPGAFNANLQYMSTLQQQQMFLSLSQFHNQLLNQQQDMGDRLGRLERSFSSSHDTLNMADTVDSNRRPYNSYENSPRDVPQYHRGSLQNLPYYLDNYSKPFSTPFNLRPNFPETFAYPRSYEDLPSQSSPAQSKTRNHGSRNINNNHVDAVRLEAVLKREVERNPFSVPTQYPQERTRSRDPSFVVRDVLDEPDAVPIETIQAQDTWQSGADTNVPRLNLDDLVRSRGQRRSNQGARPKQSSKSNNAFKKEKLVGQKFPTPSRANAAAKLASQKVDQGAYKPGLSSGISGTACETASISSAVSSVPGGEGTTAYQGDLKAEHKEPDEAGDYSLFEALRETIYSEVATLISQNETRPHYLIEIFRELQMLTSDYLRQRALYAVQELVTQYQTEEVKEDIKRRKEQQNETAPGRWVVDGATAELTPSVSAFTSEEDEIRAKLYDQIPHLSAATGSTEGTPSRRYDYSEKVENPSTVDTPDSGHWELPFAKDSLGETVIHLDKLYDSAFEEYYNKLEALQRMREYERRLTSTGSGPPESTSKSDSQEPPQAAGKSSSGREGSISSSAQDNGSEGSVSDVPDSDSSITRYPPQYPRIDTQQLDQQIKGIMTEIIPVLKEHMDDVCSQQLLQYIKRLVLTLTNQQGEQGHEFVRFFQKQLGSILQDSLSKFDGRKMRDCGEDLLVDLSEILFNELAFFRLMQDLDNPEAKSRAANYRKDSATSTEGGAITQEEIEIVAPGDSNADQSSGEESDTEESSSEEDGNDNVADNEEGSTVEKQDVEGNYDTDSALNEEEQEDLGKDRDDEMASQMAVDREDDDEEEDRKAPMKIQLAPSETKPMNRIGSDEDDEGEDEDIDYEDISDTAVSHEYGDPLTRHGESEDESYSPQQPSPLQLINNNLKKEDGKEKSKDKSYDSDKEEDTTEVTPQHNGPQPETAAVVSNEVDNPISPDSEDMNVLSPESVNNTVIEVVKETEPVENHSSSNKSEESKINGEYEDDFIEEDIEEEIEEDEGLTLDDLPVKLTGLTKEELGGGNSSAMGAEAVLDYVNTTTTKELAGDDSQVREPDPTVGTQV